MEIFVNLEHDIKVESNLRRKLMIIKISLNYVCVHVLLSTHVFYRTHMQNIKDITSSIHYEMYRVRRLNENNMQANGLSEHHPASHEI